MYRRTFIASGAAVLIGARLSPRMVSRPIPSRAQLDWQREELAIFLHFGVNTFTDREWGDGREDPGVFNPTALDARQWASSARAAGFRMMILTAKHHDGFCLWPTTTTRHSVASSPWRGGRGDLVREFVDASRAEGLRVGLYLSPWDRNHPSYGDSPRYNDVYIAQLTELLTRYGQLAEVWFDGANGEGPNGKRQLYDWPRVFGTVKHLQPNAVVFSDAGPDVRWCGNERGEAGDPNWSTIDPAAVPFPGATGEGIIAALQHGHPDGSVWRPAEADVSIRPGWFYHPAQDDQVRSPESLLDLYLKSVGRNSKLLLNVPPTREGLLHERDIASLMRFRDLRTQLADRAVRADSKTLSRASGRTTLTIRFRRTTSIDAVRLEEDVTAGQVVARYVVQGVTPGGLRDLSRGTTIGYAKIDTFPSTRVTSLRVIVEDSLEEPRNLSVVAYGSEATD